MDINSAVGRKAAIPDAKLLALTGDDLAIFTDVERVVIELADAMAATPAHISDDLFARLRAHFSEEQLMELAGQIAFENYRSRWNRVFDVGSDHLYQPAATAQ